MHDGLWAVCLWCGFSNALHPHYKAYLVNSNMSAIRSVLVHFVSHYSEVTNRLKRNENRNILYHIWNAHA